MDFNNWQRRLNSGIVTIPLLSMRVFLARQISDHERAFHPNRLCLGQLNQKIRSALAGASKTEPRGLRRAVGQEMTLKSRLGQPLAGITPPH
jgi:hypothetical protein